MEKRSQEIDFIKGCAILSVLLLHSLSNGVRTLIYSEVHIAQAVPIFIAVTFYLSFINLQKCSNYIKYWFAKRRIKSLFRRIVFPVFAMNIAMIVIMLAFGYKYLIINLLRSGGGGPGSYYLWIYLQLWLLMPVIYKMFNAKHKYQGIVLILIVSILCNILCSVLRFPPNIYRLLCVRYLFLSAIAWVWIYRMQFNRFLIYGLSVCSLVYLEFIAGSDPQPFVYEGGWSSQNYPIYFWTYSLIIGLLYLYSKIKHLKIRRLICWMGCNSWEIFVMQMFVFGCFRPGMCNIFSSTLNQVIYVFVTLTASIIPIVIYEKVRIKLLNSK